MNTEQSFMILYEPEWKDESRKLYKQEDSTSFCEYFLSITISSLHIQLPALRYHFRISVHFYSKTSLIQTSTMQPTTSLLAVMFFAGAANAAVSSDPAFDGFRALWKQWDTDELSVDVTFSVHDRWQHWPELLLGRKG